MMNELKMTEIKTLSWTELEMLVNDLKKKHTNKGLTDVETKILKGIFDGKTYRDLAEEIRQEEQSIKNAAYDLFKILSDQTGEKRLFGLCYAMDGGYKGWNPYIERHLAIFVNCFCSRAN